MTWASVLSPDETARLPAPPSKSLAPSCHRRPWHAVPAGDRAHPRPCALHDATTKVVGSTGAPSAEPDGTGAADPRFRSVHARPGGPIRTAQGSNHSSRSAPGAPTLGASSCRLRRGIARAVRRSRSAPHTIPPAPANRRPCPVPACSYRGDRLGSFGCRSLSGSSIYPNPYSSQCSRYSSMYRPIRSRASNEAMPQITWR